MDAQRKPPAILFVLIILTAGLFAPLVRAAPGSGEAQLIDGGVIAGARYAGLRIRLPADALTYWRDPGEAGVAPNFDFSRSENLDAVEVLYPAPARFEEGGAQANGYKQDVVFPVRLKARDADRPIALALALDYAVCAKLCIPAHADLRLDLPPRAEASPEVAAALAQVPRPLTAEETKAFAALQRAPEQNWRLTLTAPARELFVEAPNGFFVESRGAGKNFVLAVTGHPADRDVPSEPLRLTATGEKPVEFFLSLK